MAAWPLVGQRVYDFWAQASTDVTGLAQKFAPQIKEAGLAVLGTITGLGAGLIVFFLRADRRGHLHGAWREGL
ncbi:hypothetical protein NK8_83000 (plasmid) [Caballeronia sp. NK8]|nr:hypothetical protein NK8_83000 [Caballeronia sp. NK8]